MKTASIFFTSQAERATWFTPGQPTTASFQGGSFRLRVTRAGDASAAEARPVAGVTDPGSSGVTAVGYNAGVLLIKWRRVEAATARFKTARSESTPYHPDFRITPPLLNSSSPSLPPPPFPPSASNGPGSITRTKQNKPN